MNRCYCMEPWCHLCHPRIPQWERDLLSGENAFPQDTPTLDPVQAVYKKYAAEIDKMYVNRTRGDYSSIGILSEFARELKAAEGSI